MPSRGDTSASNPKAKLPVQKPAPKPVVAKPKPEPKSTSKAKPKQPRKQTTSFKKAGISKTTVARHRALANPVPPAKNRKILMSELEWIEGKCAESAEQLVLHLTVALQQAKKRHMVDATGGLLPELVDRITKGVYDAREDFGDLTENFEGEDADDEEDDDE